MGCWTEDFGFNREAEAIGEVWGLSLGICVFNIRRYLALGGYWAICLFYLPAMYLGQEKNSIFLVGY